METKIDFRGKIEALISAFFQDTGTMVRWMRAENPLLGGMSPNKMLEMGRGEKLLNFVKTQLEENKREEITNG